MTGPFNQDFVNKGLSYTVSPVSANVAEYLAFPSVEVRWVRTSAAKHAEFEGWCDTHLIITIHSHSHVVSESSVF